MSYTEWRDIDTETVLKRLREMRATRGIPMEGAEISTSPRVYKGEDGYDYVSIEDVGMTDEQRRQKFLDQVERYGMSRYLLDESVLEPWKCLNGRKVEEILDMTTDINLVLFGPAGTGKTTLAMLVADQVQKAGKNVQIRRWNDWLSEMRDLFRSNNTDGSYATHINMTVEADLLVLDELADVKKDKVSSFESQTLFDVVSGRYGNRKPTIFTTNLSRDAIARLYGYPCSSRIYDRSMGAILDFSAETAWR